MRMHPPHRADAGCAAVGQPHGGGLGGGGHDDEFGLQRFAVARAPCWLRIVLGRWGLVADVERTQVTVFVQLPCLPLITRLVVAVDIATAQQAQRVVRCARWKRLFITERIEWGLQQGRWFAYFSVCTRHRIACKQQRQP